MIGEMIRNAWTMVARLFVGLPKESETKVPEETYKNIFASTQGQTAQQKRSSSKMQTTAKKKSSATTIPRKTKGRQSKTSSKASKRQ